MEQGGAIHLTSQVHGCGWVYCIGVRVSLSEMGHSGVKAPHYGLLVELEAEEGAGGLDGIHVTVEAVVVAGSI